MGCPGGRQDPHQALEFHCHLRVFALELHDEHGRRVRGVARLHRCFGGVHREAIHDLHRSGQQARLDDTRHGIAGRLEARIRCEDGAVASRPRHEAQRDLERDAEQALRPDEQPAEICAGLLEAVAPECGEGPVAEHDPQPEHVVRRHPVPEAVRPPGVERHVAADRADRLARGVRRVVQPVRGGQCRDCEIDDAGFDDGEAGCGSNRRTRFMRFSAMTIPSSMGTAPPERLVPLPRAMNGTCAA